MKKLILLGLTLAIAAGVGYLISNKSPATETFQSEHISFAYNQDYQKQPQSQSVSSGLSQLVRLDAQNPARTITLKFEKDAKTGATLTKQNFLDFLEKNAEAGRPVGVFNS